MREVARWSVFPLMLVAALAVTAVAIARGAPPAAAVFLIYLAMMPIVAGLERALPYRRAWNERKRDLLTDALYLPTTWGLGALLSPAFAAVAVGVEGFVSARFGEGLWPEAWPLFAQVALAWLLHKSAVTSVIIGARRMDQLEDNFGSVDLTLTDDEVAQLDEVSQIPPGYPAWMGALGDDRRPGEMRDIARLLREREGKEESEAGTD